ncbi:MAG TPA: hypothetical protein VIJ09_11470 [Acidimicrobiales bacterium]
MSRAPIDTSDGRPTGEGELNIARQLIRRSGVVAVLGPFLDADVGRPREISLEGFLVVLQLNALHRHHQAHLVQVARVLNALTDAQRTSLGMTRWDPDEAYARVDRFFVRLCEVLDEGHSGVDAQWFANQLARAAIPKDMLTSHSVAVDGTDVESWGALRGATFTVELDGEAAATQLVDETESPPVTKKVKTAKVFGIGPDGRKCYTPDPDARAGHRSATASRNAGPYVGYELHLAVQTRDVRWTNYVDKTFLGSEVPSVITTCNLVAAGTHRGGAIVDALIAAKTSVHDITDVVWDPGYSLCLPGTTTYPLTQAGIEQTIELVTHQRGIRPFAGEALLVDGQLYSTMLPKELRDLRSPPRHATGAYRRAYQEYFNQRARWRLVRHSAPDSDGVTRWRCPFCAGLLRSRNFPKTMRRSRKAPLVALSEEVTHCCSGTLSAPPAELPITQKIPFGTTAWQISMNRRMVVESANSALKGAFADLSRGFFRVFGRTKISVLLGFTVAAYNLDRIRSFRAKQAEDEAMPLRRAKRRKGTWATCSAAATEPVPAKATGPPD